MQTFEQSLAGRYRDGLVTLPQAMLAATNPHDLRLMRQNAGLVIAAR